MTNTRFPKPNFYQNYNNTNNNQLVNTQRPTQINERTIPHTNHTYGNQPIVDHRFVFSVGFRDT